MPKALRLTIPLLWILSLSVMGESPVTSTRIETFIPPERQSVEPPNYPSVHRHRSREGWVTATYMIAPTGIPYDVTVAESSGDEKFEKAAIKAIEKWRYKPATLNGEAIDAGVVSSITFQLADNAGARRRFVRTSRALSKAIGEQDKAAAESILEKQGSSSRNLYEEAFFQLGLAQYHSLWGTPQQQYAAVSRAAFVDRRNAFLPETGLTSVLLSKLRLEADLSLFQRARKTANKVLSRDIDDETKSKVQKLLEEIETVIAGDGLIQVQGYIKNTNHFVHLLARSSFHLKNVDGAVAEARLHCQQGYVGFPVKEDFEYTVQNDLGDCRLSLIGDPQTTFDLMEY